VLFAEQKISACNWGFEHGLTVNSAFLLFGLIFSRLFAHFAEINQQILTNYVSTLDADFGKRKVTTERHLF
jgi:type VI protein secretion system component VasA